MKIYVVTGSTGEYSDLKEWLVVAFQSEEAAIEHINKCKEVMQQFDQESRGYQRGEAGRLALEKAMKELDPSFYEDYTGTYYYHNEVELR